MDDDEMETVMSVYCLPGECCFEGNEVIINLSIKVPNAAGADLNTADGSGDVKVPVKVFFCVGSDYPRTLPDISMFSEHLNRDSISSIKAQVSENFRDYSGEPMILAISSFIYEAAKTALEPIIKGTECGKIDRNLENMAGDMDLWTAVLHIDHMRNKNKYCKTLERWAEELHLTGRIVFLRRLILVLLQGCHDRIKDFIIRLRTVTIDVDSKGHSCKEKMMKVLSEEKSKSCLRIQHFQRSELLEESELQNLFLQNELDAQWKSVLPLLNP